MASYPVQLKSLEKLLTVVTKSGSKIFQGNKETFDFIYRCLVKCDIAGCTSSMQYRICRVDRAGTSYYYDSYGDLIIGRSHGVDIIELYPFFDDIPLQIVQEELLRELAGKDLAQVTSKKSGVKLRFTSGQTLIVARYNLKRISQLYIDLEDEFGEVWEIDIPLHVDDQVLKGLDETIKYQKMKIEDMGYTGLSGYQCKVNSY